MSLENQPINEITQIDLSKDIISEYIDNNGKTIKKYILTKKYTDEWMASKEGEYFDQSHYNYIVDHDADVYTSDGKLLLKFRKKMIPYELCIEGLECFRDAAKKKHENRGASAGVLDRDKLANYIGEFVNPGKFRTGFISAASGVKSKQATSNLSPSNIIGFYDKPDRNLKGTGLPCRQTAFNRDHPLLWEKSIPFLQKLDECFKVLIPERHAIQYARAQQTPQFIIPNTAYSTITINYSWRTALHKDAGDLKEGYGNLIVIEDTANPNSYIGGMTGFPQFGCCVDVRTGDYLAMDVHEWHANTEMIPATTTTPKGNEKDVKNGWYFNRLSIVCYLREKMLRCKDIDLTKTHLKSMKGDKKEEDSDEE